MDIQSSKAEVKDNVEVTEKGVIGHGFAIAGKTEMLNTDPAEDVVAPQH